MTQTPAQALAAFDRSFFNMCMDHEVRSILKLARSDAREWKAQGRRILRRGALTLALRARLEIKLRRR